MEKAQQIIQEVKKAVVGKDEIIKKVMMVILAKGHILLEDIPGVGKTTLAVAFSKAMSLESKRMQFTPDVMPSDVTGFSMLDKQTGELRYVKGSAFCNLFLADEINRTSAKTQSALLEVMEEGKITVDGFVQIVPKPFMVIATQNPLGSAGTQLLPESQLDRFMVRMSMGYPSNQDEVELMKRKHHHNPLEDIKGVVSNQEMIAMCTAVEKIHVEDSLYEYMVKLVDKTRANDAILQGASPRATLALCAMAKASAYLQERDYVVPQDIIDVFQDTIGHRILLAKDHRMRSDATQQLLATILQKTQAPTLYR